MKRLQLKYGCNPNQHQAHLFVEKGSLPITVLQGSVGYINALDALNGWQLVSSLYKATGLESAASFKHVSPAGSGVALALNDVEKEIYFISQKQELSPIATAYVRARGADRLSSFGDFISLSSECDLSCANVIKNEVSDGIIAPSYSPEALELLKKKKRGNYLILQVDPSYQPPPIESRSLFGITLTQQYNDQKLDASVLQPIVTKNTKLPKEAQLDLIVALNTLKYTQSNSVCYASRGQAIGIGAGQQSRIHCTRLAGDKADLWHLRQSDIVRNLPFKEGLTRNEKDNAIDQYLRGEIKSAQQYFSEKLTAFSTEMKQTILQDIDSVSLASDGFFPFRDNIDRARQSGVRYIVQPGGSVRDDEVIASCDEYNMVMITNSIRLFHH
ncbi:MAG: phosphoribosylaminoimidazolecarboxamide formyltransferase [Sphaerochaetaceae bacterium]|jgi:phosphoribosylaminoimidazolecarboxamide formyltransferase/IMP cyclohydrolase